MLIAGCDPQSGAPAEDSAALAGSETVEAASTTQKSAKRTGVDAPATQAATVKLPPPPSGPAPAPPVLTASVATPAAPPDYFLDATSVPLKLQAKLGVRSGIRALELVIYPKYVKAQILDPARPLQVDAYILRETVEAPRPVKLGARAKDADLGKLTFDLAEIDWTLVPRMVVDAPRRFSIEQPGVTHINISRPVPFEEEVRFRVYVSGPRGSGSVMYDTSGRMTKIHD